MLLETSTAHIPAFNRTRAEQHGRLSRRRRRRRQMKAFPANSKLGNAAAVQLSFKLCIVESAAK